MVTITMYTRQQKRHWSIEQSFGLYGRGRVWDDLREWHWNMYNIIYGMSHQSRFDARYWMLGAGALGRPRGMVWGGRREEGLGWGTHVYLWWIHFDIWQNQYNIVKLKNKIKFKKIKKKINQPPGSSIFDLCILVALMNTCKRLYYWVRKQVDYWLLHFDFATCLVCEPAIPLLIRLQLLSSEEDWGLQKSVKTY